MLINHPTSIKKITPHLQDSVAETLLIPLYMRATLTQADSPILTDSSAVKLVEQIDYDFEKFSNAKMSLIGCGVRADFFDQQCLNALSQAMATDKNLAIINVGCGLDDRYQRVFEQANLQAEPWQQRVHFYEMDLPEVIAFRQQLLPAQAYQTYIAGSLLNDDWLNALSPVDTTTTHYLVLIEGVLMYFNENQVKDFFLSLAQFFQMAHLTANSTAKRQDNSAIKVVFDSVNSLIVNNSRRHDAVSKTKAEFKWAMDDSAVLQRWNSRYRLIQVNNIMDIQPDKWGFLAKILRLIPKIGQGSKILTYHIQ